MKYLACLLFVVQIAVGQGKDSLYTNMGNLSIGNPNDYTSDLMIGGSSGGSFLKFHFSGDSLIVSGNMKLDSAAHQFIQYVIEQYSKRIQDLKHELRDKDRLLKMHKIYEDALKQENGDERK